MGVTIIGPTAAPFPAEATPAIVEVRKLWSDKWEYRPEIDFVAGTVSTGGQGIGQVELRHRYGEAMRPYDSAYATPEPAAHAPK